jgi:hypothetical protein
MAERSEFRGCDGCDELDADGRKLMAVGVEFVEEDVAAQRVEGWRWLDVHAKPPADRSDRLQPYQKFGINNVAVSLCTCHVQDISKLLNSCCM